MQELTTITNQNDISLFNHPEFGNFRGLLINNEPYFVGKDIAESLGYSIPRKAITDHCRGVLKWNIPTNGGIQEMLIIPESDVYKLIFSSKLPNAEKFIDWVTHEVLPSIRKHGAYMDDNTIEKALTNPDFLIRLATELKQEKAARLSAETKIQNDRHKVQFAEAVASSGQCINVGDMAKILAQNGHDIGQNRFFQWLRIHGYIMKNKNVPTQRAIDLKIMEIKEGAVKLPNGNIKPTTTPVITGKGQIYFINKFNESK